MQEVGRQAAEKVEIREGREWPTHNAEVEDWVGGKQSVQIKETVIPSNSALTRAHPE